ncbi:hypothetical protein [Bradyrhizobium sp. CCGUVB23]|uniref:hypothetical protein n=1 Tax=Bradyrhizobium sp. CCGUVB23 TaxID=2949630 RepID=UPI0020B24282|nr:hypothetical protein [Bradyrhizobium sp. CCGUVB23]MCP3460315.1 hypothetical protein [Bradyrhizobium sp. CCGUVB23]
MISEYLGKLELKDAATVSGVVISLVFNVINFRRTSAVRRDTLRLDEFKRLRGPVDAVVTLINSHRNSLRSLEASGTGAVKLKKAVAESNKALSDAYNQLEDALSDLDRSQFVKGKDWTSIATEGWDEVVEAFDRIYARNGDAALMKEGIKKVIIKIDELVTAVKNRLDTQIG